MATITKPPQGWNREESDRRVRHPLERLRGYIRFYTSAEGVAVLALYVALWFWIGLLLDYGSFKLLGWDWVQRLPHTFRAVVLGVLVAGLLAVVATKVLLRLFREFRHTALALVMERRFPRLLGDRLITAVELADPRLAARYGYSQAMIDQTIQEAASRVDETPVHEVFNWRRLLRYAFWALALTAGMYLLAGLAGGAYNIIGNRPGVAVQGQTALDRQHSWTDTRADLTDIGDGFHDFHDVAAIWFERNILLYDTIWPRRAQLELIGFPGEEKKIGRNAPPMEMRVRALKWVIADSQRDRAPEGWRALRWSDLNSKLVGMAVPELPADWKLPEGQASWRVDDVELRLDRPEISNKVPPDTLIGLRRLFGRLDELTGDRGMRRKLRRLEVPSQVTLYLWGATESIEQGLPLRQGNEYAGTLPDLKESVRFEVRAEDYATPVKKITVVPPPELTELRMDTAQPAYLYHRPWAHGSATQLKGLRQQFRNVGISLTGEKSVVEIPSGSNLVLRASSDKALANNGVRLATHEGAKPILAEIRQLDEHTFETHFGDVTAAIDLTFEFTDTDGVKNDREVVVKPAPDLPPEVDVQLDVLRRMPDGSYLCTPTAQVPFKGKIRDDHGLSEAQYAYTIERASSDAAVRGRAARIAGAIAANAGTGWPLVFDVWRLARTPGTQKSAEERIRMATFGRLLDDANNAALAKEKLFALLQPLPDDASKDDREYMDQDAVDRRLIKDYSLDSDPEYFDVSRLGLKSQDPSAPQPHYFIDLSVVATDNDVETGPHTSQNKERYRLQVVSEEELIAAIANEENDLHRKLSEKLDQLRDAKNKLDTVAREMPGLKPDQFVAMVRRTEEINETVSRASIVCQEIFTDYRRIGRELDVNRNHTEAGGLVEKMMNKVQDHIVKPLDTALNLDFVQTDESVRKLGKVLDVKNPDVTVAAQAQGDMERLIERLDEVLRNMQQVLDVGELVKSLQKIKTGEDQEKAELNELLRQMRGKIFEE